MALIRNGSNQLSGLNRIFGAVGAYGLGSVFDRNGTAKAFNSGDHAISGVTSRNSRPAGARHPVAWLLPTKAGGLASHNEAEGSDGAATATGNVLAALGMAGSGAASCTATATIGALAWAVGEAAGSCTATLTRYATGRLYGSITPYTELSPQTLAAAVIDAAEATPIAADIRKVNAYAVTGNGQTGTEWGPA